MTITVGGSAVGYLVGKSQKGGVNVAKPESPVGYIPPYPTSRTPRELTLVLKTDTYSTSINTLQTAIDADEEIVIADSDVPIYNNSTSVTGVISDWRRNRLIGEHGEIQLTVVVAE